MEEHVREDAEVMYKALLQISTGDGTVNSQTIATNAILKVIENNADRALQLQSCRVPRVIQPLA